MGIAGLLPKLQSIQEKSHIRNWAGKTVGVDAYGWLHKGTIGCAVELAQEKPTRRYVDFAMNRVKMLRHFGVMPYLVFDGDYLPSKARTESDRAKRRQESKAKGLDLLKLRRMKEAQEQLQKAIDVTPLMARHLIDECKTLSIPYVVAPYEADAQLYYLERIGEIDAIVSEDSDLLAFGCKNLITKMDKFGECLTICRDNFTAVRGPSFSIFDWTDTEFRYMCILSGCDYLANIPSLGLVGAYKLVKKHKTPERIIQSIRFDATKSVPVDYLENFKRANLTFLHQWVFCPKASRLVMCTEPDVGVEERYLDGCGKEIEQDIARGVALGDLDPMTKESFVIGRAVQSGNRTTNAPWAKPKMKATEGPENAKSIKSYFKPKPEPPKTPLQCKSVNIQSTCPITRSAPTLSTPAPGKRSFSQFEVKTDGPVKKSRLVPNNEFENSTETGERSPFFKKASRHPLPTPARSNHTPGPRSSLKPKGDEQPKAQSFLGSMPTPPPTAKSSRTEKPITPAGEDEAIAKVVQGLRSKYGFRSGLPVSVPSRLSRVVVEKQRKSAAMSAKKCVPSKPVRRSQQIPPATNRLDSSGESQATEWPDFVGIKDNITGKEMGLSRFGKFTFKGR